MSKGMPTGKYPNTFYRVSLKAVIKNDKDEVLCVKENGSNWSLPGGGLDHGETIEQGLARELHEEVGSNDAQFTYSPLGSNTLFLPSKDAWLMWIVYEVKFDTLPEFYAGVDADEICWIDPKSFKDSSSVANRLVYKWCVDQDFEVERW